MYRGTEATEPPPGRAGDSAVPGESVRPRTTALLTCLQLTDSAFPSGFYTLSHGLEGYAQAKAVDSAGLPGLLADLLRHGVGPADATALAAAHRAVTGGTPERAAEADRRLHASKLNREMRVAATRTGRQLLDLAAEIYEEPAVTAYLEAVVRGEAPGNQAVAAGVVHAATGVPLRDALLCDLFAFAASFAGAALRLRLTDHRRAQTLLHGAGPVIEETAELAMRREPEDIGGTLFTADVMSGRHERAEARLFAS